MNKIIVNRNKINNYQDEKIEIKDNVINFNYSDKYYIEYIDCDSIKLEFNINNCEIELCISSFDNELDIFNKYNIRNGNLEISKFYNNRKVFEKMEVNLLEEGDKIEYNFANICLGEEEYVIDINHMNKKTVSNIKNKTVSLKDSKINFIINSRVDNIGIKSILDQNTRIVTMDECEARICPNMFIDLDDVVAKHGSVIGTFKDDQVFYLMSKGISYDDSLKLLVKGYLLSDVLVDVDLRMKIMDKINKYWR